MLTSKQLAAIVLINDTEIRFIDKTNASDPTRREDFWIDTLKTCFPQGFNNIKAYYKFLFLHFYKLAPSLRKCFVLVCFWRGNS